MAQREFSITYYRNTAKIDEIVGDRTVKPVKNIDALIEELTKSNDTTKSTDTITYKEVDANDETLKSGTIRDFSENRGEKELSMGDFIKLISSITKQYTIFKQPKNPNAVLEDKLDIDSECYKLEILKDGENFTLQLYSGNYLNEKDGFVVSYDKHGNLVQVLLHRKDGTWIKIISGDSIKEIHNSYKPYIEKIGQIMEKEKIGEPHIGILNFLKTFYK